MMRNRSFVIVGLVAVCLLPSHGAGAAAALDDATILARFDQANAADIVTGRLGAKYGASAEVRALATMVVTDHVAVQQMGRDLAKKLKLIPPATRVLALNCFFNDLLYPAWVRREGG